MVSHAHKVSNKGQIVVPAKYRKRLNINPADRMNFRIRGNVLIVEKAQDTGSNIEYIMSKKHEFGEEHLLRSDLEDIIRDLLHQQFYLGDNVLTDRVGRQTVKVRGADSILEEVINVLTEDAEKWLEGDYASVLIGFAEDLDIDFPTLLGEFTAKMRNMEVMGKPTDRDTASIPFALAVGETLSEFRTRVGDIVTERLIKEAEVVKEFIKDDSDFIGGNFPLDLLEDIITDELAQNFSILMNLRVLKEFARVSIKSVGERPFKDYTTKLFDMIFKKKAIIEAKGKDAKSNKPSLPSFEF